ncbi:MAG: hypothetical protein IT276_02430 [Ignavibacteriaceae bacterium]|nr:hypothetical protein [Ignavibacteriaceae bacterium]HMN24446.1 DUF5683 domain-containing protein [Ignavibacteriaceae bacterium]HRN25795.1 DUF5683 domain-containing protein [Ignavibacteriaceae bacterium]HRP93969.1 DUF5683 domain-containing protein [Ignavibacteriaceae bacterium]HRQ53484.1 DUF5683 domain-containing protein [Ignavibacteriaceae bacterium]
MKSLTANTIKIFLLFIILNFGLFSQQDTTAIQDTTTISSDVFVMQKSPWGAVARSAIIPGLGQIYNESYWKAPVVWGIMGWFVYAWIDNNNKYIDYKNLYIQTGTSKYIDYRDFYRDQRDEFAIYIALTYFLNLVDAYVDAHLFDFSVGENYLTKTKMLNIRVNF